MFRRLDHIAIVVSDTDEALAFYRDALGLPLLFSEVLEEQAVRLTHLDLYQLPKSLAYKTFQYFKQVLASSTTTKIYASLFQNWYNLYQSLTTSFPISLRPYTGLHLL